MNKKIFFGLFIINFLTACSSPTAMLGPVYTLSSTGSIYQSSLTYGTNEMITMYTGKTPLENIQDITVTNKKNIQKETLESEDFYFLVKNKIEKTGSKLNISN
tara:strand:- start:1669 stop:1977 length:309 start_codon:yes stop_codon:yes gene_type:complete